MFITVAKNHLS